MLALATLRLAVTGLIHAVAFADAGLAYANGSRPAPPAAVLPVPMLQVVTPAIPPTRGMRPGKRDKQITYDRGVDRDLIKAWASCPETLKALAKYPPRRR